MTDVFVVRNNSSQWGFTVKDGDKHRSIGCLFATRGLLNAGLLIDGIRVENIPQSSSMIDDAAKFFSDREGITAFTVRRLDIK